MNDYDCLQKMNQRIMDGLLARRPHESVWKEITALYEGIQPQDEYADFVSRHAKAETWVNTILSAANTMLPSVIGADPRYRAYARRKEDVSKSKATEVVTNFVWTKTRAIDAARAAALDALLYSVGFVKIGWSDTNTTTTLSIRDSGAEIPEEDVDVASVQMMEAMGVAPPVDPTLPYVHRVEPWRVIVPNGITTMDEAAWVAEEIYIHIDDFRSIPMFAEYTEINPTAALRDSDGDYEYVRLFEYREWRTGEDGTRKRWVSWALAEQDTATKLLHSMTDPIQAQGWPYAMLRMVHSPTGVYGSRISEIGSTLELSKKLSAEWNYVWDHHSRSKNRKYAVAAGNNDEEVRNWLQSDQDMAYLILNTEDAGTAIQILPEAPPPSDTGMVISGLASLMYEVSGLDAVQRGNVSQAETATAARISAAGTANRLSLKIQYVEEFLTLVARKLLAVTRQFIDSNLVVRLTNDQDPDFMVITPDDLVGEYDVEIVAGSAVPNDPVGRSASVMNLTNGIAQITASLMPAVQAGVLPPSFVEEMVQRLLVVYNEDPESFALEQGAPIPAMGQGPQPMGSAQPSAEGPAQSPMPAMNLPKMES